jgi:hypothetical protein
VERQLVSGRGRLALSLAALAACVLAVGLSAASFTDTSQNPQTVSADPDFLAPSAGTSAIAKAQGGVAGYVKAGGAYRVYADVSDSGNPASGIASVKADVSAVSPGQTAVSLSPGSYLVEGVAYNYRSAQLTAAAGVAAGSKSYGLVLADGDANARSQSFSVAVDNGPFAGNAFDTANGGGNSGKPEAGDTVAFTYGKAPEPASILAGWNGVTPASVSVSIGQSSSNDTLAVAGTALGSVALKGDYVAKTVTFSGSTIALVGSSVVLTLGTPSSPSSLEDENGARAPIWSPSASAYDRAANACSPATVTAAAGRQF